MTPSDQALAGLRLLPPRRGSAGQRCCWDSPLRGCLGTTAHCVLGGGLDTEPLSPLGGHVPLPSPDSLSSGPAPPPHPRGPLWSAPRCDSHPLEAQMGNYAQRGGADPEPAALGAGWGSWSPVAYGAPSRLHPQSRRALGGGEGPQAIWAYRQGSRAFRMSSVALVFLGPAVGPGSLDTSPPFAHFFACAVPALTSSRGPREGSF